MSGIPHTKSPDLIPKVLHLIQSRPIPAKVDAEYLQSAGLIAKDDRNLVSLLKGLQFITQSGKPTERWAAYRVKPKAPRELASDVRVSYAELFTAHPNAPHISDEAIAKVVRNATKFNDADVHNAVETFRTLCQQADFSKAPATRKVATPPKAKANPPENTVVGTLHARATTKPNESIDLAESELLKLAQKCVDHDLYLPAYVMAWAAFMEFLFEKLSADGLVALRALHPAWQGDNIREIAEYVPEREFVESLKPLGFCTKNEQSGFVSLLQRRNECAHPTSGYRPGLNETLGYISELLNRTKALTEKSL